MKSRFLSFILLAALTIAALAVQTAPARAMDKITIAQFGSARFLLYLPLYVAMEEGLFRKNGIDVTLKFAGNDDQIFAAVASGDADFGMGDPVFTAIAQEKGFPARTVALMITSLGISGYTNNPKVHEIKNADDLAGLRVGSFPQPSTTYTLLAELKRNHPALKDMKIIEAPMGAQLALIEAGKADIAIDLEPAVSVAEDQGYPVVFSLKNFTDPQAITGLMTTQTLIDKNSDLVRRAVLSLQEAMNVIHGPEGFETAVAVGKKISPDLSEKVIRAAVKRMMGNDMYPKSVVVQDAYWQRTLKTRLDSGDLHAPQPTEKAVDNSFAVAAEKTAAAKP